MDHGIKVSKEGFNILNADLKDQIFNSSANSLKIWATGSADINADPAGTVTLNLAHGLGYKPFFLAYFRLKDSNKRWFQDSTDATRLLTNFSHGSAKADDTYVKLSVTTDESAFTARVYYIIFIDKSFE